MFADVVSIAALVVSILAAGAAFWSAWSSKAAADAAKTTAALDSDRRHDQLEPEFEVTFTAPHDGALGYVTLKLTGPSALGWINATTAILPMEGRRQLWQFDSANQLAEIADGRTTRPLRFSLPDGKTRQIFNLENTQPGREGPLRLGITCQRGDDERPWLLSCDIQPGQTASIPPRT